MDVRDAIGRALAWASGWFDYAATLWILYQAAIIVTLFLAAKLAARRIEPLVEDRARQIKGHPGLPRVVIALLRRTDWILFTLFLLAALNLMRAFTWPSRTHLSISCFRCPSPGSSRRCCRASSATASSPAFSAG